MLFKLFIATNEWECFLKKESNFMCPMLLFVFPLCNRGLLEFLVASSTLHGDASIHPLSLLTPHCTANTICNTCDFVAVFFPSSTLFSKLPLPSNQNEAGERWLCDQVSIFFMISPFVCMFGFVKYFFVARVWSCTFLHQLLNHGASGIFFSWFS